MIALISMTTKGDEDAMNAVDRTRELAITSQRAEPEHLLVSVSETGSGLPPQQADQIFNAFFTTNPSRGASFHLTLPTTVGAHE